MKRKNRSPGFSALIFVCLFLFLFFSSSTVQAFSSNWEHEIGVYSLYRYGFYNGERWKGTVTPSFEADPAGLFWNTMTGGTSSIYAHNTSRERVNAQVNYHTIFPISGDGWKDWDRFDMVFFYGHNNMMTPPHHCGTGHFWSNNTGSWTEINGDWCDWGTPALPYEYYYIDLTTGQDHPGSVTYLYEPFTSVLLGYQFQPCVTSTYQISAQDAPSGNSPGNMGTFVSGLGTRDLEWLILHGCQAVIVANENGSSYDHMGVNAFRRTYDGFHIILGHYRSYYTYQLKELASFANNLMSGMPIQAAYFLTDPACNSSAISRECKSFWSFFKIWESTSHFLRNHSYMNKDTWTNPMRDNRRCRWLWFFSGKRIWYVKWIRQLGTEAEDWE
ncbi:hypothetical protein KAW48_02175 [candidate division WOR-3 bacterium]|nr:hypothetical protein [candidate division WOR-3 bacterium]